MINKEKVEKIRALVTTVLSKDKDHLSDPTFSAAEASGFNYDDAFELGVEQGCYDMAFSVMAILEEKSDENSG